MVTDSLRPGSAPGLAEIARDTPDRRDGRVYVMPGKVGLAVRVALATGRPLLLRGDPGSGKSSLAAYEARKRGWRYYEQIVTSRTQAQDLLWTFDSIRRLADAQLHKQLNDHDYVEPGPLWWAFARSSALRRGAPEGVDVRPVKEPGEETNGVRSEQHSVVLIDEIDKADPDLPNGLLVPLGSNEFQVSDTGDVVSLKRQDEQGASLLTVITTNEERELPEAFLRRCVVVWLADPDRDQLTAIAEAHLTEYEGGMTQDDKTLAAGLADTIIELRKVARHEAVRPPSTAEYLDALHACRRLGIRAGSDEWADLTGMLLTKRQQPE
jgi:MoxR-like ATPase